MSWHIWQIGGFRLPRGDLHKGFAEDCEGVWVALRRVFGQVTFQSIFTPTMHQPVF